MNQCIEQYGIAVFTLVLVAILIFFSSPLGMKIKNATTNKVSQTEEIGKDGVTVATGGVVRPDEPTEAVDQVWCYIGKDGELVISQTQITAPNGSITLSKKIDCIQLGIKIANSFANSTLVIKTVRFEGAVKVKTCEQMFYACTNLKEIKNIENLYTNECTNMRQMFRDCNNLETLDIRSFDTSKVENMAQMFLNCNKLTAVDVSKWNTMNCTTMFAMFSSCNSLQSLDLSRWNLSKMTEPLSKDYLFTNCSSFSTKSIKVSQSIYDELISEPHLGITTDKFDIIN